MRNLSLLIIGLIFTSLASAQTLLTQAENFQVVDTDQQGHELFMQLNDGKLVLLDFFSTSCGPCGTYAPEIQAAYEHFGRNKSNVYFLSIAWGSNDADIQIWNTTHGLTLPSVSGFDGGGNAVNKLYQIQSRPTVFIVLPDGSIPLDHIWPPTTHTIDSLLIAYGGIATTVPESNNHSGWKVFPNPAKNLLNIQFQQVQKILSARLFDLHGKNIQSLDTKRSAHTHHQFKLAPLPDGLYLIHLQMDNGKELSKRVLISSHL